MIMNFEYDLNDIIINLSRNFVDLFDRIFPDYRQLLTLSAEHLIRRFLFERGITVYPTTHRYFYRDSELKFYNESNLLVITHLGSSRSYSFYIEFIDKISQRISPVTKNIEMVYRLVNISEITQEFLDRHNDLEKRALIVSLEHSIRILHSAYGFVDSVWRNDPLAEYKPVLFQCETDDDIICHFNENEVPVNFYDLTEGEHADKFVMKFFSDKTKYSSAEKLVKNAEHAINYLFSDDDCKNYYFEQLQRCLEPIPTREMIQKMLLAQNEINAILGFLTPREEEVIQYRFGLNGSICRTPERTAQIMECSIEKINSIEQKVFRKLVFRVTPDSIRRICDMLEIEYLDDMVTNLLNIFNDSTATTIIIT